MSNNNSSEQDPMLSPPWVIQSQKIINTIGDDDLVHIEPLKQVSGDYVLKVIVHDEAKAQALNTLIVKEYIYGNVRLLVEIEEGLGRGLKAPSPFIQTPEKIAELVVLALETNQLYKRVIVAKRFDSFIVFPIISAEVIQFFDDDISDFYQNFNGVASNVFQDVMLDTIDQTSVNYSTEKI
ncbi:hypothetical protein [Chengkuizengella marina]|uniref:Uncharacterized protein n=1 Tax=Chengkuizengella marina TaxID=2507566 RepID=A0A6N9Q183_9BACL|nr:hypothetical protein [Chengkuizengella marina]NBI29006.1 hypothetical protein [Chengkuizengella marina]